MAAIKSYSELKFYIQADRIMNGCSPKISMAARVSSLLSNSWGGVRIKYLRALRCYSYYKHAGGFINKVKRFYYGRQFRKLGIRLGLSIGEDVFGYGLVLLH